MVVPGGRHDLAEAARSLGGRYVGSVHDSIRGTRTRRWSTVPQTAWAEPTAAMRPAEGSVRGLVVESPAGDRQTIPLPAEAYRSGQDD
jgi:hypothetical protein